MKTILFVLIKRENDLKQKRIKIEIIKEEESYN